MAVRLRAQGLCGLTREQIGGLSALTAPHKDSNTVVANMQEAKRAKGRMYTPAENDGNKCMKRNVPG